MYIYIYIYSQSQQAALRTYPNSIQAILVDEGDFSRTVGSRLNSVLMQLPVILHHIQLLFHRDIEKCLLYLVILIASGKDDSLLGSEERRAS